MDLVHLACILCRLTAVARLELPVACGSNSIFDYEFGHAAPDVQTLLPPTMFLDLFERMRPLGHLRALDVTLELLVRIPSEALQQVACLSLRIEAPEQPRACEAVTRLSGQNLQSLRILRKCHGQGLGPQESPARLCAALNVTGLTYLELRDIGVEGTCTLGSVDRVADTIEAEDAVHMVPSLTTIVWEPAWVRSYSKGDPSYQKMVQEYLLDLLDIFGEALVVLREDDTSAQIMGRHTEGSVELTQVPIEERWWELDSWGELWLEVLRTVDSWGELWLEVLRTVGNCV
ncbi:hypothetical protein K466DRAFT_589616 [Polyporus arcularius HHB13444]|uniref:F-box domain-containing protein n=1 Tax=Polyporus arcularius HHB13444 TaxID=1314778 RepID=A0A5C3P2U1_9APHY|nr:hypothetical protein K466DRAFT_589616 [Polyporus arcularius HHB13444]